MKVKKKQVFLKYIYFSDNFYLKIEKEKIEIFFVTGSCFFLEEVARDGKFLLLKHSFEKGLFKIILSPTSLMTVFLSVPLFVFLLHAHALSISLSS